MSNDLTSLSQEELFKVLRNLLKSTQNELLANLAGVKRVQALFNAIKPSTWEKACVEHFDLKGEDPKAVYLQHYPKHRLTLND